MKKDRIPEELKQQIERELLSGERLLWTGQPTPLRFALRKNPYLTPTWSRIITGVLLVVTLLTFVFAGVNNDATASWLAMVLLVITLVAAGASDLLERYGQARRIVYAVTDRRAFTHSPSGIRSHMPQDLKTIERVNHTRNMGDIIFGHQSKRRFIWMFASVRDVEPIGFFNVQHPEQVEALLMETFNQGDVFISDAATKRQPSAEEDTLIADMEENQQELVSN